MSTLKWELETASNAALTVAIDTTDVNLSEAMLELSAALRARATRFEWFPAALRGDIQIPGVVTVQEMFEWLTGDLPTPTPAEKEET